MVTTIDMLQEIPEEYGTVSGICGTVTCGGTPTCSNGTCLVTGVQEPQL
ncbi:hypothetical protein [Streptomyces sp. TP-A0874]|nr:hypothetical protein [Streptomyces sp. TP-A0874]